MVLMIIHYGTRACSEAMLRGYVQRLCSEAMFRGYVQRLCLNKGSSPCSNTIFFLLSFRLFWEEAYLNGGGAK